VALWDVRQGREARRFGVRALDGQQLLGRAISPDGRFLVTSDFAQGNSGYQPPVCLWDLSNGRHVRQVGGMDMAAGLIAFSPDGRMLATAGPDRPLQLWEVQTGKERCRLVGNEWQGIGCIAFSPRRRLLAVVAGYPAAGQILLVDLASGKKLRPLRGHEGDVRCLSFSPDGTLLASGSADTTALVWDAAGFTRGRPAAPGAGRDPAALWEGLADADAARAYRALWGLVAAPEEAVPLLRERLRPVPPADTRIRGRIAELGSTDFATREKATRELKALGELARPALEELLESKPEPEVLRRARRLLEQAAAPPSRQQLRQARAVEALEYIGSAEARRLLQELAGGAPGARLTEEAGASLRRLERRTTP
jgi:hypothetical protein